MTKRIVAVIALIGLAIVLSLAALDVLSWRGQSKRADVAVARVSHDLSVWQPHTVLPIGVSRWLLGTGDDVSFGRALQRFQILRSNGDQSLAADNGIALANEELALDQIIHSQQPNEIRGRAQQLHAILLFNQLQLQGIDAKTVLERSIDDFRKAVRTDPTNATAKYDLEVLYFLFNPISQGDPVELARHRSNRGTDSGGGGSPGSTQGTGGF